jgi:hypothetical protein
VTRRLSVLAATAAATCLAGAEDAAGAARPTIKSVSVSPGRIHQGQAIALRVRVEGRTRRAALRFHLSSGPRFDATTRPLQVSDTRRAGRRRFTAGSIDTGAAGSFRVLACVGSSHTRCRASNRLTIEEVAEPPADPDSAPPFRAATEGGWTDYGVTAYVPTGASTSCLVNEAPSGNGVTNRGNGGTVIAYLPNEPGAWVQGWLYIYYNSARTSQLLPAEGGTWYGPLVSRGPQELAPNVRWTITPGYDAYMKVLWKVARWDYATGIGAIVGGWAPNLIQGSISTTEFCHYP